jgi:hypothetical protein
MTNEQESRQSMYLAVRDFSSPNTSITTNLPNYTSNLTIVTNTITQIQSIGEQQKFDKTGITEGKNQLKTLLITTTADNSRKLTAYAKFTNNPTLLGEVKFTESDLKRCADTALKDYAQIVYDRAQTNVASLTNYGITAATQTAFLTAINNYNAVLASPRVGITVKSQATKQLVTLFKTADDALANMDTAVEIIRLSQANFYNGYKTARKIVDTGIGSLALKGTANDLQSGEPIQNATFTFKPATTLLKAASSNGNNNIVKKTATKGSFNIKSMPEGTYSVTITKPGYKDQIVTVSVVNGEMTDLVIQLEKT